MDLLAAIDLSSLYAEHFNEYWTPRLKEDNDPISAKPANQILSLNLAYTFFVLIFF